MSKQKQGKITVRTTPEKNRHDKPSVQIEGKLSEEELEAIAGGQSSPPGLANHNEIMVRTQEVVMSNNSEKGSQLLQRQKRTRQVEEELTGEQLEAIAGGKLTGN